MSGERFVLTSPEASPTVEKRRIVDRRWTKANPEKRREKERNDPGRKVRTKAYFAKHPEKVSAWNHKAGLKRNYRMTPGEYGALLQAQGGVCAVCRGECKTGRRLCVDHDHETGAIRGLLCNRCNASIGHAEESAGRLRALADYLEKAR